MPKANMANRRQNPTLISYAGLLLSLSILFVISNNSYALKGEPQPKLDSVVLDIGGHALDTEVALTAVERQRGLSYRQSLGEDSGMLFVYRQPQPLVFTMRETSIPLAIAFLDPDFVILEIQQMEPFAKHHYFGIAFGIAFGI